MKQSVYEGNVGVITTLGQDLHIVTGVEGDIVYCKTMQEPPTFRACLTRDFWVLLDYMP